MSFFQCLYILLYFLLCLQEEPKLSEITAKCNYIPALLIGHRISRQPTDFSIIGSNHTPSDSSMNLVTSINLYGAEMRKFVCARKSNEFETLVSVLQQ